MEQRAEKKIYMEKLGKRAVSAKETVAFLNAIQRQERHDLFSYPHLGPA